LHGREKWTTEAIAENLQAGERRTSNSAKDIQLRPTTPKHATLQASISELLKDATIPFDIVEEPLSMQSDDHLSSFSP
jgi:hypothetical protein